MKQVTKKLMIIAGSLVAAGLILTTFAFAFGGLNITSLNTELPYEEKNYTYSSAEVKSLSVKDVDCDVELVGTQENKISVTTLENEKNRYDVKLSPSGELRIEYHSTQKWYEYIHFGFYIQFPSRKLTIEVPEKFIGEVKASTVSGNIALSTLDLQKGLTLSTTSGELSLTDTGTADRLTVSSVSGGIELENCKINNALNLSTTSGDISVDTATTAGDITASTISGVVMIRKTEAQGKTDFSSTSGDISMDASTAVSGISVGSGSGSIRLEKSSTKGDVDLHSTSGDINFTQLSGNNLKFKSISGEVAGTLLGKSEDYSVAVSTTSGAKDVPQSQNGSKRLEASTTSGDISIRFE